MYKIKHTTLYSSLHGKLDKPLHTSNRRNAELTRFIRTNAEPTHKSDYNYSSAGRFIEIQLVQRHIPVYWMSISLY